MTKIGKLWTGAVAYVSLLVGAGLSVAGNLADTYRTRGADVDTLDKVMAAGWPILVLLAIEMFVSPRWSQARMFQAWRWLGCLAVGGMAMVVSWTHLHDLMASRGQLYVVSVLGPLAIDGMAIMATGLILSTRVRRTAATDMTENEHAAVSVSDVRFTDDHEYDHYVDAAVVGFGHVDLVTGDMDEPMATRPQGDYDAWQRGYEDALEGLGQELATEAEAFVRTQGVDNAVDDRLSGQASDKPPQRVRTSTGSVPDAVMSAVRSAMAELSAPDPAGRTARAAFVRTVAAQHGTSERTARRWVSAAMAAMAASE